MTGGQPAVLQGCKVKILKGQFQKAGKYHCSIHICDICGCVCGSRIELFGTDSVIMRFAEIGNSVH